MIGTRLGSWDTIIPLEWRSSDLPKPVRCSAIYQEPTLTWRILNQSPQHERLVLTPNRLICTILDGLLFASGVGGQKRKVANHTLAWMPVNEDIRNAGILESRRTQDEITFNTTFSSCFLCFWMIEIELNQLECESEFKLDTVRRKR